MKRKRKSGRTTVAKNLFLFILLPALLLSIAGRDLHKRSTDTTPSADIATDQQSYVEPKFTKDEPNHQILRRMAYTTSYNKQTRTPNWVGWTLTANHTDGEYERKGHKFLEDKDVPAPRATYADIRESECGYQRGHMCPAADNKWSRQAQQEAFLMTNICPQDGDLNQRDWKYLEEACRDWAGKYGRIHIVCGPIFRKRPYRTVGEHRVAVPDAFFKVVLVADGTKSKAIGFLYENTDGHHNMEHYARSVDEIEAITQLDFFHQLDDRTEARIEAGCNLKDW